MDQQLLCHWLLQSLPISSDLLFCQQTSPEHRSASPQPCWLPHTSSHSPCTTTRQSGLLMARALLEFLCLSEIKKRIFCICQDDSTQRYTRQAQVCQGYKACSPQAINQPFRDEGKNFPLSIGYSSLADKIFPSSSSPMSRQALEEQGGCGTVHCLSQRLGGANHLNNNRTESKTKTRKKYPTFIYFLPSLTA